MKGRERGRMLEGKEKILKGFKGAPKDCGAEACLASLELVGCCTLNGPFT